MDDLPDTEPESGSLPKTAAPPSAGATTASAPKPRRKPGPRPKENPHDAKETFRLTEKDKAEGDQYCKKYGLMKAKQLRASWLSLFKQTPSERLYQVVDTLMPLNEKGLSLDQKQEIRVKATERLKKFAPILLLILLGCASIPLVKFFWYQFGLLIMSGDQICVSVPGKNGCLVMPAAYLNSVDSNYVYSFPTSPDKPPPEPPPLPSPSPKHDSP
jgi:hypothetical protein